MCFSPEVSFASGAIVGGVGVVTLTQIRHGREVLLGILPLLFGIHQLEEGVVWLGLQDRISTDVGQWAEWLYILFAHALLPALVPCAFWLSEPDRGRKKALAPLVLLGLGLTAFALVQLTGASIDAEIRHHGIEYQDPLTGSLWFAILYVIATCAPPFFSSYPWMFTFGAVNLAALIVTACFKAFLLTSVWCALAAVISVLVYLHLRRLRRVSPGLS